MVDGKKQKIAALIVICVAATAFISVLVVLAGSYVYMNYKSSGTTPLPSIVATPGAEATQAPTVVSNPIQISNPFHIESMKVDKALRTYTFSLSLEPGAHPAEVGKISVNATHAGKDYGTVWNPGSGDLTWTRQSYDDGALHYGDVLTLKVDISRTGIPMDDKHTQLTFMYDGRAAFTEDMNAV